MDTRRWVAPCILTRNIPAHPPPHLSPAILILTRRVLRLSSGFMGLLGWRAESCWHGVLFIARCVWWCAISWLACLVASHAVLTWRAGEGGCAGRNACPRIPVQAHTGSPGQGVSRPTISARSVRRTAHPLNGRKAQQRQPESAERGSAIPTRTDQLTDSQTAGQTVVSDAQPPPPCSK
jgi:hypothetical protein